MFENYLSLWVTVSVTCALLSDLDASDFTLTQAMGSFQSGDTQSCMNIIILGDNRVEGTETFTVTLTGNSEVEISSTAGTATVEIIDDDGEFSLCNQKFFI